MMLLKEVYPLQQEGVAKERAEKYLSGGNGALMGFELKGGLEARKEIYRLLERILSCC